VATTEATAQDAPGGSRPRRRRLLGEIPVLLVAAVLIALVIKTFLLQAFYIPSGSMQPTLREGDRVLVEKVAYRFDEPDRGDVVVFQRRLSGSDGDRALGERIADAFRGLLGWSTAARQDFIKRVVAVGGDTVEAREGAVWVNGRPLSEPYLSGGTRTSTFARVAVPEGSVFVLGDNRGNSNDSLSFGAVPVEAVVGHAFLLVWPPHDFRTL
jgi:signal peptidase I